MSDVLERAIKQFREKIAGSELLHIDVPQWPDEQGRPTLIYFRPLTALRLETFDKVVDLIRKATVMAAVDILILRALNADLTPMFKSVHRLELIKNIDPHVLLDIIARMGELDAQSENYSATTLETLEKN